MTCKTCDSDNTKIKYIETLGLGCQPDNPPLMPWEICQECGSEDMIEEEENG